MPRKLNFKNPYVHRLTDLMNCWPCLSRWLDSGQITELVSIRFSLVRTKMLCSWLPTSFFQLTFFLFSTFLTSHYLLFYVLWLHFILKAVLGVYSFNSLRSRLKKETLLFDFDLCESRGRVASGGTSELRNSPQYLSLRRFFCSIPIFARSECGRISSLYGNACCTG